MVSSSNTLLVVFEACDRFMSLEGVNCRGSSSLLLVQSFPSFFKIGRSKENEIVEPWKFNLKIGVGSRGW